MSEDVRIYKYPLQTQRVQYVLMPEGSKILSAQMESGQVVVWAVVDVNRDMGVKEIVMLGTGDEVPRERLGYISTVQASEGLALHFFEKPRSDRSRP